MGLFERLERALERLIEGRLMGGFRGRVHPVEIARRVGQQMQAERRIGVDRTYVPNVFRVTLNPLDYEPLRPIEREVEEEIIGYLTRQVQQRDFSLPGCLRIELEQNEAVASGGLEVTASLERDAPEAEGFPSVELPPPTRQRALPRAEVGTRAVLLGNAGLAQGKVLPLRTDVVLLGRSAECEVHVPDGQVSKTHARLEWDGATYVLTSLGRNGTRVNGQLLTAPRPLQNGDNIAVGNSTLHFRLLCSPL